MMAPAERLAAGRFILVSDFWILSSSVRLAVLIARIEYRERPVRLRRKLKELSVVGLVDIGDQRVRNVGAFGSRDGKVKLPHILQSRRIVQRFPSFGIAAGAWAVVHHHNPRRELV